MITLGVSGGVDSSVCAVLLKKRQENVMGVFMDNWGDNNDPLCSADRDRMDALRVCASLGIPFSSRNFSHNYKEQVFASFLEGYARGTTPNPDILCNREVKFKVFLSDALNNGADKIATGHYVRTHFDGKTTNLLRGRDPSKDQSYFLHAVTHEALARSVFPLGDMLKSEVRAIAEENNLVNAKKKDSTGICFIGERDFKDFLSKYLPAQEGDIMTMDGKVIGRHAGALYYTVGQAAPLGGVKGFLPKKWFILDKCVNTNTLVVTQDRNHPLLHKKEVKTNDMHWVAGSPPASSFEAEVQIRHLGEAIPASIVVSDTGVVTAKLSKPHFAQARGQYAVLYQGDVCLGGGEIA